MEKKWASCSTRRRLTIDPNFLDKEIEFQDKFIVHELLHFRYPNHGKMFKRMLNIYFGEGFDYLRLVLDDTSANHYQKKDRIHK